MWHRTLTFLVADPNVFGRGTLTFLVADPNVFGNPGVNYLYLLTIIYYLSIYIAIGRGTTGRYLLVNTLTGVNHG